MGDRIFRRLRVLSLALVGLFVATIAVTRIMHWRETSNQESCKNHYFQLGLIGLRHYSGPDQTIPAKQLDAIPPATILSSAPTADSRLSWIVGTLPVLQDGIPNAPSPDRRPRPQGLKDVISQIRPDIPWSDDRHRSVAQFRLSTAVCPTQAERLRSGGLPFSNYVGCGGLGLDAPARPRVRDDRLLGVFNFDSGLSLAEIADGQRETIQIIETTLDPGPWLQGGSATARGLAVDETPYLGVGRPFGGCHQGITIASMADGSIRVLRQTIHPGVFRALWTYDGGDRSPDFEEP